MDIYWHRRDHRTVDVRGLAGEARLLPVYVVDPAVVETLGTRQRAFVHRALESLRARYRELGTDLVVRHGEAAAVLEGLTAETGAECVRYAEGYTPARRVQQARVDDRLETRRFVDTVLVDPASLMGGDLDVARENSTTRGDSGAEISSYDTYSQFYRAWQREPKPDPVAEPNADRLVSVERLDDHESTALPFADVDPSISLPEASQGAARERLKAFCDRGLDSYGDTRDDLAAAVDNPTQAVSRLSPYLAVGLVGIRELWQAVATRYVEATGDVERNVESYGSEIAWREWAYHQLSVHPQLATEDYDPLPNEIEWRDAPADLAAWKRGETGFPLVDAGMAQLEAEGYIHNRPRQVVASFLTKHLLIDWRAGERHFRDRLIDYDPATNPASWQWIASTGTDSVDNRIFDPVSQFEKYDPDGRFVRAYVPQLADVPAEVLAKWPTLEATTRDEYAPSYPDPIVDRNEGFRRAKAVFGAALGEQ